MTERTVSIIEEIENYMSLYNMRTIKLTSARRLVLLMCCGLHLKLRLFLLEGNYIRRETDYILH